VRVCALSRASREEGVNRPRRFGTITASARLWAGHTWPGVAPPGARRPPCRAHPRQGLIGDVRLRCPAAGAAGARHACGTCGTSHACGACGASCCYPLGVVSCRLDRGLRWKLCARWKENTLRGGFLSTGRRISALCGVSTLCGISGACGPLWRERVSGGAESCGALSAASALSVACGVSAACGVGHSNGGWRSGMAEAARVSRGRSG